MRRADRLVRRLPRGGKQTLRLRLRRRGERRRVGARRRHLGVLASREERSHILRAFAGPSVEIVFEQSNTILSRAASCALSYCQLLVPLLLHLLRRRERNTHARLRAQEARRVQLSAESLPPRISPFLSVSTLSLTRAHRPRAPPGHNMTVTKQLKLTQHTDRSFSSDALLALHTPAPRANREASPGAPICKGVHGLV